MPGFWAGGAPASMLLFLLHYSQKYRRSADEWLCEWHLPCQGGWGSLNARGKVGDVERHFDKALHPLMATVRLDSRMRGNDGSVRLAVD